MIVKETGRRYFRSNLKKSLDAIKVLYDLSYIEEDSHPQLAKYRITQEMSRRAFTEFAEMYINCVRGLVCQTWLDAEVFLEYDVDVFFSHTEERLEFIDAMVYITVHCTMTYRGTDANYFLCGYIEAYKVPNGNILCVWEQSQMRSLPKEIREAHREIDERIEESLIMNKNST